MIKNNSMNYTKLVALAAFFFIAWYIPIPEGLTSQAWHTLVIFIITIVGIVINVMPLGAIAITSMVLCIITNTMPIEKALSGFSSPIVWLVVTAFLLARGIIKTGLGTRIAYFFISKFGKTTLGLGYSIVLTELILSPMIPSASARGGGIIFPIAQALANKYSETHNKDGSNKNISKIGAFLIQISFHANVITSAMFLTAMAANPIAARLAGLEGISITWGDWALGAIVPGIMSLIALPPILYVMCNPGFFKDDTAPKLAAKSLKEMGTLKIKELLMLIIFGGLIFLWIMEKQLGINATTTALIGLVLLLITDILTWEDVVNEKGAWKTLIWFAILITIAEGLSSSGITSWLSSKMIDSLQNQSDFIAVTVLLVTLFYAHYLFASSTTYISVMYSTFLALLLHFGMPPLASALGLAIISILSAGLTHYGISSAPVFYGAGYLTTAKWWRISFIVSTSITIIWLIVGIPWWKSLGWL